jgi:hypothetical protein
VQVALFGGTKPNQARTALRNFTGSGCFDLTVAELVRRRIEKEGSIRNFIL